MFRTIFTTLRALLKSGLCRPQLCIRSDTASYGDSLDLDLPLRTSLHLRGRADVRPGRVDAADLDRRGRELGERWAAVQQLEQRQRGEVEQIRAAFKPRSQVLPTVHEFTHDTLVTRFVGIPNSTSITSSFPAILNDSNNA